MVLLVQRAGRVVLVGRVAPVVQARRVGLVELVGLVRRVRSVLLV